LLHLGSQGKSARLPFGWLITNARGRK
jgi:hypothetical protein